MFQSLQQGEYAAKVTLVVPVGFNSRTASEMFHLACVIRKRSSSSHEPTWFVDVPVRRGTKGSPNHLGMFRRRMHSLSTEWCFIGRGDGRGRRKKSLLFVALKHKQRNVLALEQATDGSVADGVSLAPRVFFPLSPCRRAHRLLVDLLLQETFLFER